MTQIHLNYSAPQILFYFLFILIWVFCYFVYRKTRPPVARFTRILCILLRGTALSLILWLLFRPVVQIIRHQNEKPRFAVLMDASASMTVRDSGPARSSQINQFLKSSFLKTIQKRASVEMYIFSDGFTPFAGGDSILFQGAATNITQAIDRVIAEERELPLKGILLLSDGAHNEGAQPENRTRPWPVPVYSVGLGESQENPDIILTRAHTNEIAYMNQDVPVEATLRGPGFGGMMIPLVLKQGSREVSRTTVRIPDDGKETTAVFYWHPKSEGDQRLILQVDSVAGELTLRNNERPLFVHVRDQKQKISILAGAPDPDLGLLKRFIRLNEHLELSALTQKPDGRYYEGKFSIPEIRESDILVLLNTPNRHTSEAIWDQLTDMLEAHPKPLLIIAGHSVYMSLLNQLPSGLPVSTPWIPHDHWVRPQLTIEGLQHVIPVTDEMSQNRSAWQQLPPIITSWQEARAVPGAKVLIQGLSETDHDRSSPLLVIRSLPGQRCVMILADQLYRWQLLMWQEEDPDDLLGQVLMNCIRWLSADASLRAVRFSMDNHVFRAGSSFELYTEVYDETLLPTDRAEVKVLLSGPDTLQVALLPEGHGQYRKSLSLLHAGEYRAIAEAVMQNRSIGKDTTTLIVSKFQPEFLNTRAQPELLKRISKQSGGLFVRPEQMDTLLQVIHLPEENVRSIHAMKPWQHPVFLVLIVFLLSLEWLIRRRKGLL